LIGLNAYGVLCLLVYRNQVPELVEGLLV
jgi:hypothetical protein